jgi:hypothetical protein
MAYSAGSRILDSISNNPLRAFHKYSSFRIEIRLKDRRVIIALLESLQLKNYIMDVSKVNAGGIVFLRARKESCTISNYYNAKIALDLNGFVSENQIGEISSDHKNYERWYIMRLRVDALSWIGVAIKVLEVLSLEMKTIYKRSGERNLRPTLVNQRIGELITTIIVNAVLEWRRSDVCGFPQLI